MGKINADNRHSTRPFLEDIEKKWIAFQLLCALRDCHAQDIFHGDIKTENVLVTSWNWLYLSDFSSSFKPTFLPEDNPADFSFYFDTSGRRTCYLAPERFLVAGEDPGTRGLDWSMDIFSAGCVIAELFLESPIFSLSQLFKYRKGEYNPEHTHLNKIEDQEVRELILHMIQIDPQKRYSAEQYLDFWRRKAFPEYFYNFLHQYMGLITEPTPGQLPDLASDVRRSEPDDRIDRIFLDFDKVSYLLGDQHRSAPAERSTNLASLTTHAIPVKVDLPNAQHEIERQRMDSDGGSLLFLTLLVSSLRNTAKASVRIRACDVLLTLAERVTDEAKLDRILPYLITLLGDDVDEVRIAAIRSVTQLLALVQVVSPVNAYIFPEYIFPRLQSFLVLGKFNPSPSIRAAYASCIASLAQSSLRILDMVQALRADVRLPAFLPTEAGNRWSEDLTYHNLYDVARVDLLDFFELHTKTLLTDSDASVRRAFLGSVASLCVFFGNLKASDVILSHLNTYLNDRDWILKCAFFETVVGVAVYVGSTSLEEFVLPLMVQSMADPEEFVVERVIRSLCSMSEIGLFQRSTTWQLMNIIARFTIHPNIWIREAAVHFIAICNKTSSEADKQCIAMPILAPYLRHVITEISTSQVSDNLKKPLPKNIFDMSVLWASKVEKGLFWKTAAQDHVFTVAFSDSFPAANSSRILTEQRFAHVAKNEEDEQWISRLRNLGVSAEDEMKVIVLREHIWKIVRRAKDADASQVTNFTTIVSLTQHGATPQTVFFDRRQGKPKPIPKPETKPVDGGLKSSSIADALLDASATLEDPMPKPTKRLSLATPIPNSSRQASQDRSSLSSSPGGRLDSRNSSGPGSDIEPQVSLRKISTTSLALERTLKAGIRHKPSAISLLNKRDGGKAFAEIGTTSETAFGKVDGPFNHSETSSPAVPATQDLAWPERVPEYEVHHTYKGNDPTVLGLLDNVFHENFPTDLFEFGPVVTPIPPRQPIIRGNGQDLDKPWQAQGVLVTLFGEHTGPVNRVLVAPDHAFFITASDDGTVRIWDTTRLEKNLTPRSRQLHRQGSKVKSITFIEDTHTFVSAGIDGSIHAVKVDYQSTHDGARYGKPQLLRQYQLPPAQSLVPDSDPQQRYAIWIEHYRADQHSCLLVATNTSEILAIDLKTMTTIFTLNNPLHHGTPTTFCFDRKHHWLVIGTSHGVLDLWDLRFRVRLRAWGIPGGTTIHRLHIHPLKGRGRWICVAGGTASGSEVTVWDVEKMTCREVYRAASVNDGTEEGVPSGSRDSPVSAKQYEAYNPDADRTSSTSSNTANTMLSRFANIDLSNSLDSVPASNTLGSDISPHSNAIRALVVGIDAAQAPSTNNGSGPSQAAVSTSKSAFMITAGSDRMIRHWDLVHPETSRVISGLDDSNVVGAAAVASGSNAGGNPSAAAAARYKLRPLPSGLLLTTETLPSPASPGGELSAAGNTRGGSVRTRRGPDPAGRRPPRSTVISLQQQLLLKRHLDEVLDVAMLERPYGMIVSVDRNGGVYVFG